MQTPVLTASGEPSCPCHWISRNQSIINGMVIRLFQRKQDIVNSLFLESLARQGRNQSFNIASGHVIELALSQSWEDMVHQGLPIPPDGVGFGMHLRISLKPVFQEVFQGGSGFLIGA